jgi:hypothetical protein
MHEFVCTKCKALLAMFPNESFVTCTCGTNYFLDWNKDPPEAINENLESIGIQETAKEEAREGISPSQEVDELYREIRQRKRKALELGIPSRVMKPCLEKIAYFPAWSQNDSRVYIPPEVTDFTECKSEDGDGVSFRFGEHLYSYTYHENSRYVIPMDFWTTDCVFRFTVDGDLVLELQGGCERAEDHGDQVRKRESGYFEAGVRWYKFALEDIKAYIQGEWIDEMEKLSQIIASQGMKGEKLSREMRMRKQKEEKEDASKIEDLKRRFGI